MYADHGHFQLSTNQNLFNVTITHEIVLGMDHAFGLEEQEITNRFNNGDTCFLVQDNGKFLGILWGHVGDCYIREIGKRLNLKQDEAYRYGVFVIPEARRKNVYNSLKDAFYKYYSAKGIVKYYALVASGNTIVRRALKKDGFIKKSNLFSIKFGKFVFLIEYQYMHPKNSFKVAIINKEPEDCFII